MLCGLGLESRVKVRAQAPERPRNELEVECSVCTRKFRRESDKKRHKCLAVRRKPLCEHRGSAQCITCRRWFGCKGGLAVHRCGPLGSLGPWIDEP